MTLKILNLEPDDYSAEALAILEKFSHVDTGPLSREELKTSIGSYDILIARLGHKIDKEILEAADNLKAIVTATTGLNHIDTVEAEKRKIRVLSLQGEREFLDTITATAEHTIALILSLIRNIPASCANVLDNHWDRDSFKGIDLANRTIGIIGYGRLGGLVAHYASALGMRVLAHDVKDMTDTETVKFVSMEELLKSSDIVSLHVLYTPETHHLIDASCFKKIKEGAVFINTARGELVDEQALLKALESGHLAGAALDVIEGENIKNTNWMENDPLICYARKHSNLLITPHIGGATYDSMAKTEIFMANKLQKFIEEKL